jgi:cytochrome c-type biogenesis protein
MFGQDVSYLMAFTAGLLSFFSPCVLPLIPAYLSYITGLSVDQYQRELSSKARRRVVLNTLAFIGGFAFIFIGVFGLGTTLVGSALREYKDAIGKVGGVIVFVFGLHFLGVFRIKWLYREKRAHFKKLPTGYIGSALIGIAFSAGWTPCVGPILASIIGLGLTAENHWTAFWLLSFYTLGLAIPFFLTSLAINFFLALFNRIKHHFRIIEVVTSLLLIGAGILMFTGKFAVMSEFFMRYWPFGEGR